jgi:hypothetical protein
MDALGVTFLREFAACWGLLAGSLLIASPVVFFKIKEHTDIEEDLKFSDETFNEVAPDTLADTHSEKQTNNVLHVI